MFDVRMNNNKKDIYPIKARKKKNFGSGQLIFENWSGGPVEVFFFLNHNLNFPNLIFQQVIKLGIQIQPVLI